MLGRDDDDPLFLQVKEAQASVLEPFLGKSEYANHGQRVVEGQRLMQAASDIMLGWIRTDGSTASSRDFYVRQLWDGKGSALVEVMDPRRSTTTRDSAAGRWPARTPAPATRVAIASYLGSGDRSTARWRRSPRPTPTRTSATTRRSRRPRVRADLADTEF